MFAQIFSILACNYEGWFKAAYITTEISFAANFLIVIVFWTVLWPGLLDSLESSNAPDAVAKFMKWYQGLLHFVPFLTTITVWWTDMALEKSHWPIAVVTVFPFYMIFNYIGCYTLGNMATRKKGTLYGPEMWGPNPFLTVVIFAILGLIQGGLFYCSAGILDRLYPKRDAEEYNLDTEAPAKSED